MICEGADECCKHERIKLIYHQAISQRELRSAIRSGIIVLAGNQKHKIYGRLHCVSGRRLNQENRVFFTSESEALHLGYRPCGHCMIKSYREWSNKI